MASKRTDTRDQRKQRSRARSEEEVDLLEIGAEDSDDLLEFDEGGFAAVVGRLQDAIDLYRDTLQSRESVLGIDHTSTQASRRNLAAARQGATPNQSA